MTENKENLKKKELVPISDQDLDSAFGYCGDCVRCKIPGSGRCCMYDCFFGENVALSKKG